MTREYPNDWEPCAPGTLSRCAEVERAGTSGAPSSRRSLLLAGSTVVVLLIMGLTVLFWPPADRGRDLPPIATLNCREAVAMFADYQNHTLSPARLAALEKHLDDCPGCADRLRRQAARHDQRGSASGH